ncbi:MAG: TRAM domain-containing protein [Candidatus Diapherotrites archaeon]|uniref:TRAM domain-containing protein n=1 Tax=Candidatus Iainarchaeum sp. TaxID=3101447 RepID=A0A8T3YKW8_9ARCH|nr:TRAM domain-containing protein [Candidatus Diapherotrites archaeon]
MGNDRRPGNRFGDIPVKEGESYDVEIEGIGEKGDGIAKIEGYVIIVPNVQKGDKVKVKVNAVRGKVSFGEVIGEAEPKDKEPSEEESGDESEEDAEEDEDMGDESVDSEEEK